MQITVRFFAAAREAASVEAERVQLPRDATLADLAKDLEARHPALDRVPLRYALGTRFAAMGAILSDGDVVALIPPVSGG